MSVVNLARHAPSSVQPYMIADTGSQGALYFSCKRFLDVAVATALIVLLSPLLIVVAILITLDSSGPPVFVQQRVGARRGARGSQTIWEVRHFHVYKFRSMVRDADQRVHQEYIKAFVGGRVETTQEIGSKFKLTNDARVTRVGRFLRRTSLDELPQLVNVLKGEMSLVGPRPVPTYEFADYQDWHRERLCALPGITGIWQVKGRCQVSFEEMVRMDIEYVRNKSFWLDIRILFLTLPAVLSGRGAE
jgi:lipopolysaccharide/colanic/teichoic acid biosynthesis glycosyltransferase